MLALLHSFMIVYHKLEIDVQEMRNIERDEVDIALVEQEPQMVQEMLEDEWLDILGDQGLFEGLDSDLPSGIIIPHDGNRFPWEDLPREGRPPIRPW